MLFSPLSCLVGMASLVYYLRVVSGRSGPQTEVKIVMSDFQPDKRRTIVTRRDRRLSSQ